MRWRRRRLEYYERILVQQRLDRLRKQNEHSHHVENLRSLASQFKEAISKEKVEALLAILSPLYRNTVLRDWPLKSDEDPNAWGLRIAGRSIGLENSSSP